MRAYAKIMGLLLGLTILGHVCPSLALEPDSTFVPIDTLKAYQPDQPDQAYRPDQTYGPDQADAIDSLQAGLTGVPEPLVPGAYLSFAHGRGFGPRLAYPRFMQNPMLDQLQTSCVISLIFEPNVSAIIWYRRWSAGVRVSGPPQNLACNSSTC